MLNVFQSEYDVRLKEWKSLRLQIRGESLETVCVHVDSWWQRAPLINHHFHWSESDRWPDPWTILSENIYCTLTRAVGICYTLLMSDIIDVHLVQATDCQGNDCDLVVVGKKQYILNYWPDTVLDNKISDFAIVRQISIESLRQNIR